MKNAIVLLAAIFLFSACSTVQEMDPRAKGAITGTAIGSGLGAIIGHQTGRAGEGVAIGAGIGAIAGGFMGNESRKVDQRMEDQDERQRSQDREIERQRREIEELRRQRSQDDPNQYRGGQYVPSYDQRRNDPNYDYQDSREPYGSRQGSQY